MSQLDPGLNHRYHDFLNHRHHHHNLLNQHHHHNSLLKHHHRGLHCSSFVTRLKSCWIFAPESQLKGQNSFDSQFDFVNRNRSMRRETKMLNPLLLNTGLSKAAKDITWTWSKKLFPNNKNDLQIPSTTKTLYWWIKLCFISFSPRCHKISVAFDRLFMLLYFKWILSGAHTFVLHVWVLFDLLYFDSCPYCFTAWPRYKLLKIRTGSDLEEHIVTASLNSGKFFWEEQICTYWVIKSSKYTIQTKFECVKKPLRIHMYIYVLIPYAEYVYLNLWWEKEGGGCQHQTPRSIILSRQHQERAAFIVIITK